MCADVVVPMELSVGLDWRLAHAEDLVAYGTCRLIICGCISGRNRKEPRDTNVSRARRTFGRTTYGELVDGDWLRVQRWATIDKK